jgi:hypothetical protein
MVQNYSASDDSRARLPFSGSRPERPCHPEQFVILSEAKDLCNWPWGA